MSLIIKALKRVYAVKICLSGYLLFWTEELVKETPLGKKSREELVRQCHEMGINYGNAIYFYSGDTRDIEVGEIFNQLVYVGEYNP